MIPKGGTPLSVVFALVATISVGIIIYTQFDTSRRHQRKVTCVNSLGYISLAISQYSLDYDDTLPRAWYGKDAGPSNPINYKWMDAISPYILHPRFTCASDDTSKPYQQQTGTNYGSYVFNNVYYGSGDRLTSPSGQKLANIAGSMTALVMDGENDFQFAWSDVKHNPVLTNGNPSHFDSISLRHDDPYGKVPCTLWINGLIQSYTLRQVAAEKQINGQKVYTGFTIEND